jgi:hypothetical protein
MAGRYPCGRTGGSRMTDCVAYYVVHYYVITSKKYRVTILSEDNDLNAMAHQPGIKILSVKVVNKALDGEGLFWIDRVRNFFKRLRA